MSEQELTSSPNKQEKMIANDERNLNVFDSGRVTKEPPKKGVRERQRHLRDTESW